MKANQTITGFNHLRLMRNFSAQYFCSDVDLHIYTSLVYIFYKYFYLIICHHFIRLKCQIVSNINWHSKETGKEIQGNDQQENFPRGKSFMRCETFYKRWKHYTKLQCLSDVDICASDDQMFNNRLRGGYSLWRTIRVGSALKGFHFSGWKDISKGWDFQGKYRKG